MPIELKLIGFGDERPLAFQSSDRLQIELVTPTSVREILHAAGIDETGGLVMMDRDNVIPEHCWDEPNIVGEQYLTLFSAFEGG